MISVAAYEAMVEQNADKAAKIAELENDLKDARFYLGPNSSLFDDLEHQQKRISQLETAIREQCSREGCHCPGELNGGCAFCILGELVNL